MAVSTLAGLFGGRVFDAVGGGAGQFDELKQRVTALGDAGKKSLSGMMAAAIQAGTALQKLAKSTGALAENEEARLKLAKKQEAASRRLKELNDQLIATTDRSTAAAKALEQQYEKTAAVVVKLGDEEKKLNEQRDKIQAEDKRAITLSETGPGKKLKGFLDRMGAKADGKGLPSLFKRLQWSRGGPEAMGEGAGKAAGLMGRLGAATKDLFGRFAGRLGWAWLAQQAWDMYIKRIESAKKATDALASANRGFSSSLSSVTKEASDSVAGVRRAIHDQIAAQEAANFAVLRYGGSVEEAMAMASSVIAKTGANYADFDYDVQQSLSVVRTNLKLTYDEMDQFITQNVNQRGMSVAQAADDLKMLAGMAYAAAGKERDAYVESQTAILNAERTAAEKRGVNFKNEYERRLETIRKYADHITGLMSKDLFEGMRTVVQQSDVFVGNMNDVVASIQSQARYAQQLGLSYDQAKLSAVNITKALTSGGTEDMLTVFVSQGKMLKDLRKGLQPGSKGSSQLDLIEKAQASGATPQLIAQMIRDSGILASKEGIKSVVGSAQGMGLFKQTDLLASTLGLKATDAAILQQKALDAQRRGEDISEELAKDIGEMRKAGAAEVPKQEQLAEQQVQQTRTVVDWLKAIYDGLYISVFKHFGPSEEEMKKQVEDQAAAANRERIIQNRAAQLAESTGSTKAQAALAIKEAMAYEAAGGKERYDRLKGYKDRGIDLNQGDIRAMEQAEAMLEQVGDLNKTTGDVDMVIRLRAGVAKFAQPIGSPYARNPG